MNQLRRPFFLLGLFAATSLLVASSARSEVTEPNGDVVPDLLQEDNPQYAEVTLQEKLDELGESIDVVAAANREPGKFSPLCSFTAEVFMRSSSAMTGIAWYNVDSANPEAVPAASELHEIIKPESGGSMIDAATIRADPAFVGPYVGFALTRYTSDADLSGLYAVYYSEYKRNPICSDCTTQDHWVAALAYRSSLAADTYYLAFEDWPLGYGATASAWSNDGDFNDKVFKLVGISCAGGGLDCVVEGKLGQCAVGLTECASDGGDPTCTEIYQPRDEVCDAIDNDCDGTVDNGDLCAEGLVCIKGACVVSCGGGEFICPSGYGCGVDGYCVEESCVSVVCEDGQACRGGVCTSPCSGIVCPLNQTCVDGACIDFCTGKVCPTEAVCDPTVGACVGTCGCTPCASDKVCDETTGYCIDPECSGVTCDAGYYCVLGQCVDACAGAVCPGGAACTNGTCGTVTTSAGGASSSTTDAGSLSVAGTDSSASGTLVGQESGCGCRLVSSGRTARALGGLLIGLAIVFGRRRRTT